MVELNVMEHGKYKNLYPHEYNVICKFYNGNEDNKKPLIQLLTQEGGSLLSYNMRLFIADVIMGKATPNRGNYNDRNYNLYLEVRKLIDAGAKLTSSTKQEGAAAIVGFKHKLSEEAVISAYRPYNNAKKETENNFYKCKYMYLKEK